MSAAGFQDFWISGSRFYFKKDTPSGGTEQPLIDFGTVRAADPINPTLDVERVELLDADGGVQFTCDERVIRNTETYDLTFSNLSLPNLAFLFLADGVTAFTQAATEAEIVHRAEVDALIKVKDATNTFIYNIIIEGVVSAFGSGVLSSDAFTAIVAATKTITTATDLTTHLAPGDAIIIRTTGLANVANARSYTVVSVSATEVVTTESFAGGDETAITGDLVYAATADTGTIFEQSEGGVDVDWDIYSNDRGIVKVPLGSTITPGDVTILYTPVALVGDRLILPQTVQGNIQGTGFIIWGRNNNADQTVREATITLTPSASNISAEDFSNFVLQGKVISDVLLSQPAGRLLQYKGTPPSKT